VESDSENLQVAETLQDQPRVTLTHHASALNTEEMSLWSRKARIVTDEVEPSDGAESDDPEIDIPQWVWLFQGDAVLRGLWCPLP
jgi:hypothetical protein